MSEKKEKKIDHKVSESLMKGTLLLALGMLAFLVAGIFPSGPAFAQSTPAVKTVFIIAMGNQNLSSFNTSNAPYIMGTLVPSGALATQYYNPPASHPAEPNYVWLEAGDNQGLTTENDPSTLNSTATLQHLATYLTNAGLSWSAYAENISGSDCPLVTNTNTLDPGGTFLNYYAPHVPFVFFQDLTNNESSTSSTCISHIRPYSQLATDLANGTVAQYNFITPNGTDDTFDTDIPTGDTWLSQNVPAILNSNAYKNNGALLITFDQAASGDGPIPMIVLSPLGKVNYTNSLRYDHSSTLLTMQEIFGVGPCLRNACSAADLSDLFQPNAIPKLPSVTISPATATLAQSQTQQFNATVSGISNTAVNWTVTPTGVGTITNTGLYTAPSAIPSPATALVTATSQADSTQSANATITLRADSISAATNFAAGTNSISGTMSPPASGSGATVALSGAVPILVQSAPGSSSTGNSSGTVSLTAPSASGDTIVLFVRFGGTTISSVTDNQSGGSNTYTSVLGPTQWGIAPNSIDRSAQVFLAKNITGGSTLTITVALAGNSTHDIYMAALEYSGVDPVNPVNATAVGTGTNGRAPATANVTTTMANVKLVATSWDSNESYTSTGNGAGYATDVSAGIVSISGGGGWANLTEDRTAPTAGTWNATASSSPAVNDWVVQMVALTPASFLTVTGDANGNYSFSGVANGSYSVTPTKTGSTFSPSSRAVTVNGNVTGINFTDTAAKFSIFGKVSQTASGSGATLTLNAGVPALVQSAPGVGLSGSNSGTVSFGAAGTSGDTIVLFVRLGGTTISRVTDNRPGGSNVYTSVLGPTPWGVAPNSTDRSAQVFVAKNIAGGSALTITVTLAGSSTHNIYMVALEYSGVDHINPVNATAVGTGAVRTNGAPATANLTTTVANTKLVATSWDSNESYTLTGNGTGYATDIAAGDVSVVGGSGWANLTEDQTAAAAGIWNATASSSPAIDDWAIQLVALAPAAPVTVTADSSGNYNFGGLANGSYTVTPAEMGFTFAPVSLIVTVNGADVTNANFTATQQTFSISGTISPAASGSGATVTLSGAASATTTADSSGNYSFSGLSNGGYTVTPTKTGLTFTPASQPATVSGADVTNVNFAIPQLSSISVTPNPAPSVAAGNTEAFTATGHYTDGSTQNLSSTATWASSNNTIATISAAGLATGVKAGGPVTITASLSGVTSPGVNLTVTAATLVSIAVTPANPSIAKGSTQQFTATGTFTDGSTQNLSSTATWSSSAAAVATINTTGLATAVGVGSTTIQATSGSVSGSTTLTVTAATLASIAVTPANPSIAKGKTQQFTATGTFTDGSTQNLSSTATWSSSAAAVATINTTGLATAVGVGSTTIQATSGSVSGSTTLTVTAATLASIAVTPANPSIAKGSTQQFTATGTFTDGSTQNLSSTATWSSSAAAVATINTTGLATAVGVGSTTIQATSGSVSGSTTLTVTAATLASIAVTPANPSIAKGKTQQFTATGTFTDGSTQNLSSTATWSSSAAAVATINTTGLATAVGVGSTTIQATSGSVSGSTTLTVTAATLASIAVTPANPSIAKGSTQQFTATGTFTDGSTQNLSSTATWSSSAAAVATINTTGLATAVGVGSTTIQATSGSVSGSTTLTVTAATLASIAVTPANPSIAKGKTQQFTATGTFTDGSTQNLSSTATWSSSAAAVATINTTGLATAVGVGSTTIQATSGSVSGSTTLTVTAATLVSIAVTPANPSIAKGSTQQFTATGTFTDGSTQNLSSTATWSSSAAAVATINTTGLATAVGVGSTTIQATSGSVSGSTTLTVTAATLASIAVTPANPSIAKGSTQQFTATGTFTDGSTQNLSSTATWSSSAAAVATINTTGLATAVGVGSTTIQATSGSVSGSTTLTVTAATLASIAVTPANPSIAKGSTQQFTATGTFTDGSTQNLSSTATWSSSAAAVATINTTGLATAVGVGSTTIQATSGSVSGSTTLTVTAATLASIAVTPANPSIAKGKTQQFTATGTFTDGSTQNLSSTATWSSSAAAVATINTTGLATAVGVGSTTIQAASGSVSGSTTLTVMAPTLVSIAVTPANPSISKGSTQQFTATGTFTDGSTQNLSSTATWSSSAAAVATINTTGLATAVGVGSTTIQAASGSVSGSTTLTVLAPTLVSIAVTPANPSISKGSTQQFTATGTFTDGSTQNLSSTATWSSSAAAVATINTTGLATAVGIGSTTIQATLGALFSSTTLTVTGGVPVLVRSGHGSSATGNSSGTVSFSAAGAAGDTIVLFARFGGTSISSVTDNQTGGSNNYVSVLGPTAWGVAPNVTDRWAQVFVAKNITGGNRLTIRVSLAGSSTHDIYMAALEYSGVDPVNPINATAFGTGTVDRNGAPTTATLTTTVANTKLVATSWDSNESYTSAGNGSGYTTDSAAGVPSISGGTGWANLTEDRTAAAAGTWNATAKSTRAVVDWVIQLIALVPAGSGQ